MRPSGMEVHVIDPTEPWDLIRKVSLLDAHSFESISREFRL